MSVSGEDEQWLKNKCYTAEGTYLLPFMPNPNWRHASVFIVGLNPIDPFREEFDSFEHYWWALTQSPEEFEKACRKNHQQSGKEKSRTRRRLSELVCRLEPINVLVTNIFAYPTVNPRKIPTELKREPMEERIVSRLISVCKPKVLFFHGREARLFANRYFNVELNGYTEPIKQQATAMIPGAASPSSLFAYHHLVGRVETHAVMQRRLEQFVRRIRLCLA